MRKNTIRRSLLFIALLMCGTVSTVWAQEQEQQEEQVLQAGTVVWEAYGLSLTLPEEARVIVDNDTRWQMRTSDMDVSINLLDRSRYTDEELGQEVVASALRGNMDLKTAHGIQLDNGPLQGGALLGMVEGDSHAYIVCLEHINTAYAFFIVIQNAAGKEAKGDALLKSFTLIPPENLIVRK